MPERIEEIIELLSCPLTPDQTAEGWTEQAKEGLRSFFLDLLENVRNARPITHIGVLRSLDTWGVSKGDLHDKIIGVSVELNSTHRK